jgi:hypothetical protein
VIDPRKNYLLPDLIDIAQALPTSFPDSSLLMGISFAAALQLRRCLALLRPIKRAG